MAVVINFVLVVVIIVCDELITRPEESYRLWCVVVWLSHRSGNRQPNTYVKPEAAITVFELLMMDDVSPETYWAIKKHWNNKFYYMVASCWFFLWNFYYDARIHEHQAASPTKVGRRSQTKKDRQWIFHTACIAFSCIFPCSQEPDTGSTLEPNESNLILHFCSMHQGAVSKYYNVLMCTLLN